MRKEWLTFIFLIGSANAFCQPIYDNHIYEPAIKTVEFYNSSKEGAFPIINLRSSDQLILSFDDLRGGTKYYSYSIEHCDADWNSSQLSPAEFLQGFNDDRINDYRYSTNTIQKYTHYELKLPNSNVAPKISGNYLLKVYADGDINKLILTRRFYVVESKVSVFANILPSNDNALRASNQKINFQINYAGMPVQNPNTDLRALILQNARTDKAKMNTQPQYTRGNRSEYNDISTNDFAGGNEFRHIDLRSLKTNSERIGHIYKDTANTVVLLGDPNRDQASYSFQYDNNGNFYILNQDGSNPKTDADYAHVYFSLAGNKTDKEGAAYIVGQFNNYQLTDENRLQYDNTKGRFYTNLYLKQGVYDYEYIWVDNTTKTPDDTPFEGSYYDTENDYQILVYYHAPGDRYEQLVGYVVLNSSKK
jgi:hypothetical protein